MRLAITDRNPAMACTRLGAPIRGRDYGAQGAEAGALVGLGRWMSITRANGSSSQPTSRDQCTQPCSGDATTREAPGLLHRAQVPCAVSPSKRMQYQQGVGSDRYGLNDMRPVCGGGGSLSELVRSGMHRRKAPAAHVNAPPAHDPMRRN